MLLCSWDSPSKLVAISFSRTSFFFFFLKHMHQSTNSQMKAAFQSNYFTILNTYSLLDDPCRTASPSKRTFITLMEILPITTPILHQSWLHTSVWLFPNCGRFAITEAIQSTCCQLWRQLQSRAPKLFSAMTASLELVHSLPRWGVRKKGWNTNLFECINT